jgi:hypothetical protein
MAKKPSTSFGYYPDYKFIDHDPVLDAIDTLRSEAGRDGGPVTTQYIVTRSGVSATTLHNWYKRKTKRPQFATVKAVVRALGGEVAVVYKDRMLK